jgi:putative endopeptidase
MGWPAAAEEACLDALCQKVSLFGLSAQAATQGAPGAQTSDQAARFGTFGIDLTGRDLTVKPGQDWNRYANGAWAARTEIPGDRSSYGMFTALADLSEARTRTIVQEAAAGSIQDADAQKIGGLYTSFMDQQRINALDVAPLYGDLRAIRDARSKAELARIMGSSNKGFGGAFFSTFIFDDSKNPERYAVYVGQAGLGLPDRDYYLQPQFEKQRAAYLAYVTDILRMVAVENPADRAREIVALETRIAEGSWNRVDRRDDDKTYNPMTIAELQRAAPGFAWREFLAGADLGGVKRVVVAENTAVPKIAAAFGEASLETLKAWAVFHLADDAAPFLSDRFVQRNFDFRSRTLSGQPQMRERWKRGIGFTNRMGEAVGRIYVGRYFPPESKAKMDTLVSNLKTAMAGRIQRLDWMGADTKREALNKLSKFNVKIGYPSKWRDYAPLRVDAADLYGNAERSAAYEWARDVGRLDEPVDQEEWGMTPQTVNAYYSSTRNEIVFPAAILQPPFFDPDADPAVNYGAIGGVIGHEITHGFDDQGRKSDANGVLRDWWDADDAAKFQVRADALANQYSKYEALPGAFVNGKLSLGENIADLGGVLLGLDAYRASLNGQPGPTIEGLSPEQRLFLAWAQVWRTKFREDQLRQQLTTGPHSPGMFRAVGPLRNVDEWYTAFNIQPGDAQYVAPADRVRIW